MADSYKRWLQPSLPRPHTSMAVPSGRGLHQQPEQPGHLAAVTVQHPQQRRGQQRLLQRQRLCVWARLPRPVPDRQQLAHTGCGCPYCAVWHQCIHTSHGRPGDAPECSCARHTWPGGVQAWLPEPLPVLGS